MKSVAVGWRAGFFLAGIAPILSCDGSPENELVGPGATVAAGGGRRCDVLSLRRRRL